MDGLNIDCSNSCFIENEKCFRCLCDNEDQRSKVNLENLFSFFIVNKESIIELSNYMYMFNDLFLSLLELRKKRILNNNMDLNEFISLYEKDSLYALEKLFMEPLDYKLIKNIENNEILPTDIYYHHKKNPFQRAKRVVKSLVKLVK